MEKIVRQIKLPPGKDLVIEIALAPSIRTWLVEYFRNTDKTKHLVFYHALSHLVGILVTEAVEKANEWAKKEGHRTISTRDFCRWFTEMMSTFFKASFEESNEG